MELRFVTHFGVGFGTRGKGFMMVQIFFTPPQNYTPFTLPSVNLQPTLAASPPLP